MINVGYGSAGFDPFIGTELVLERLRMAVRVAQKEKCLSLRTIHLNHLLRRTVSRGFDNDNAFGVEWSSYMLHKDLRPAMSNY